MKSSLLVCRRYIYWLLYLPLLLLMSLWHFPLFHGRQHAPRGAALYCSNHTGLADPIWILLALRRREIPWIMAKKSLLRVPLLGKLLHWFGVFGIDRDNADFNALKKALTILKDGEQLLMFPEGTRIHEGQQATAKSGALLLASRAQVPLVPVYVSRRRFPLQPVRCIIGEPYFPVFSCAKPDAAELTEKAAELLARIHALGERS